jgi:hypothetical protein
LRRKGSYQARLNLARTIAPFDPGPADDPGRLSTEDVVCHISLSSSFAEGSAYRERPGG